MTFWVGIQYLDHYDLDNWGGVEEKLDAACWDFRAAEHKIIFQDTNPTLVSLGVKISLPSDTCLMLSIRSGMGLKGLMMSNGVGWIDPDYRGELKVPLITTETKEIYPGDRIVQGKLMPVYRDVIVKRYDVLDSTERDEGGFGSTGNR